MIRQGDPRHTGEQRYEVDLVFSEDEQTEIYEMTADGKIVPDKVTLVWTRRVGRPWVRLSANSHGSRIEGHVKIANAKGSVGPRKTMEIYTRSLGNFKTSLEYLPGLRSAIEKIEGELPD